MPDFYIVERPDDSDKSARWTQVGSGREVIDFAITQFSGGDSLRTELDELKDILGALLERAAIDPRDMLNLCGLESFDVEEY